MATSKKRVIVIIAVASFLIIAALLWSRAPRDERAPAASRGAVRTLTESESSESPPTGSTVPAPAGNCSVAGRAHGPNGEGVAGVKVCINSLVPVPDAPGDFIGNSWKCGMTAADGTYRVTGLVAGNKVAVEATLAEHVIERIPTHASAALHSEEQRNGQDFLVRPTTDFAKLVVHVDDEGGGAIPGARVTASRDEDEKYCAGDNVTNEEGVATLLCLPGSHRVVATRQSYIIEKRNGLAPGTVRLVLRPGGSISGRLVGAGVDKDVPYRVYSNAGPYSMTHYATASDGAFTIDSVPPGAYQVVAFGSGLLGHARPDVVVGPAEAVHGVEIEMAPTVTVRVNVHREHGVCEGPRATLKRRTLPRVDRAEYAAADATVEIEGVPPGTYEIAAGCGGAEKGVRDELVVGRDPVVVDYTVPGDFPVTVMVLDERGHPVDGAEIIATTDNGFKSGKTDPSGVFRLRLFEGHWKIGAEHPQRGDGSVTVDLDATRTDPVTITVRRGYVVFGRVEDGDRRPIENARVQFAEKYGLSVRESVADADGRFEFTNVSMWGGELTASAGSDPVLTSQPIEIDFKVGEVAKSIVVVLSETRPTLEGVVTTVEGAPAPRTRVTAYEKNAPQMFFPAHIVAATTTGEDGKFVLENLAPRSHVIVADHESEGIAMRVVSETAASTSLRLSGFGALTGRVVTAEGRTVSAFDLTAKREPKLVDTERHFENGQFRLDAIHAGRYTVTVRVGALEGHATVDVPPGGHAQDLVIQVGTR